MGNYVSARQPTPDILGAVLNDNKPELIRVDQIAANGGTQMRAGLNQETVAEYLEALRAAPVWPFPPVIVFYDGEHYWLGDGFHRVETARQHDPLQYIPAEVRPGNRRDAILFAAGANAQHGLRRSNADKRRAVETLLRDEEWAQWSNVEIAKRCAVAESSVRNLRAELESTSQIAKSDTRTGADGRTINTANIGQTRATTGLTTVHPTPFTQPKQVTRLDDLPVVASTGPVPFVLPGPSLVATTAALATWCKAQVGDDPLELVAFAEKCCLQDLYTSTWYNALPKGTNPQVASDAMETLMDAWNAAYEQQMNTAVAAKHAAAVAADTEPDYGDYGAADDADDADDYSAEDDADDYSAEDDADDYAADAAEDALAPVPLAQQRLHQLTNCRQHLQYIVAEVLESFGDLTGRYTLTLAVERELQTLLAVLDQEINALTLQPV